METAVGFMQFAGIFFSWWGFFFGAIVGTGVSMLGSLSMVPSIYRIRRRRELRRMWQANCPRPMPEGLMPEWGEYTHDDHTVDRRCVCHGRRIFEGETVLLWPERGPMGTMHVSVYCESVKESV